MANITKCTPYKVHISSSKLQSDDTTTHKHKIISLEAYRWARLRLNYYYRSWIENEPSRSLQLSSFLKTGAVSSLSSFPKLMQPGRPLLQACIGKQHLKIPRALYPGPSNAGSQIQKSLVEAVRRPRTSTRAGNEMASLYRVSKLYPGRWFVHLSVDLQDDDFVNVFVQQVTWANMFVDLIKGRRPS